MNPWLFRGEEVTPETLSPYFGFVYIITDIQNGKKYVGQKQIWFHRKVRGATRRKRTESDWRSYFSSNEELKMLAKEDCSRFRREILHLCRSKGEMNWKEIEEIVMRRALYSEEYMNDNISGKYFRKNVSRYYADPDEAFNSINIH